MRTSLKAPVALALGAAIALGSTAPSFALGGVGGQTGVAKAETALPIVLARGGARYQQLQDGRTTFDGRDGPDAWLDERDARATGELAVWEDA